MLSIKKVKKHGMKDPRWTNLDRFQQYKGIINLYKRDQKIVKVDNQTQGKKNDKFIKVLKKEIQDNRFALDNAIYGDKQIIKNILAEYEEFRLAFSGVEPTKIIEYVHQNTFNKRKLYDLLNYKIKQRRQQLIELKLQAALLEDRLKYSSDEKLPVEMMASNITGKVQDAVLRREAAIVVQHSYKAILDVMKRDHDYMFQVLEALQNDAREQGRCMFNTTTLGQLATEYLDDRMQEFQTLEQAIKKDMKVRSEDLVQVRNVVESSDKQIRRLIRRDSDITLNINHKAFINQISEESLGTAQELKDLEEIMQFLKEATLVSTYKCIFPCIQEQANHRERLNKCMEDLQNQRNSLFKKLKHSHQMYKVLTFSKGATRYEYEQERDRLKEAIEEQKERKRKILEHELFKSEIILKARVALQRVEEMVLLVSCPKLKKAVMSDNVDFENDFVHEAPKDIIETLEFKLATLQQAGELQLKPDQDYVSYNNFQKLMGKISCSIDTTAKVLDESLIAGITFEDPSVPSRQDIKKVSQEIVKANIKVDESLLPEPPKKHKFKFKK